MTYSSSSRADTDMLGNSDWYSPDIEVNCRTSLNLPALLDRAGGDQGQPRGHRSVRTDRRGEGGHPRHVQRLPARGGEVGLAVTETISDPLLVQDGEHRRGPPGARGAQQGGQGEGDPGGRGQGADRPAALHRQPGGRRQARPQRRRQDVAAQISLQDEV